VLAQNVSGYQGETTVDGEGGDDRRDDPADELPARAPIAKAASVQAANAIPRKSNSPGESGEAEENMVPLPVARYGW
jgi:hypothetical protein